jgi:hypothetical protein
MAPEIRFNVVAEDGSLLSEGCNNLEQAKREGEESGADGFTVEEVELSEGGTAARRQVYDSRAHD